jgi:hypothetical protein
MEEAMVTDQVTNDAIRIVSLTDRELWMIRAALEEYLTMFGHHQGGIVHEIKALVESLSTRVARDVRPEVPGGIESHA